jgi:hypothetical protein
MHITTRNAVAQAHAMIALIGDSQLLGLAERKAARARAHIVSLRNWGLLDRLQYEALTVEAELTLSRSRGAPGHPPSARRLTEFSEPKLP